MAEPVATYRLQLREGFGFEDASAVAPYLSALGVSHLYLSPFLQAAPGSAHGYDVTDPGRVNPELGGEAGYQRFCGQASEVGLALVLDIVPNHMAAIADNPWWWDVLEKGRVSRYASYFDIEWNGAQGEPGRIALPVLGDRYEAALQRGELRLVRGDRGVVLRYFDRLLPLSPESAREMESRDLEAMNSDPRALDELISRQSYSPTFWREASERLCYRRFFDIDGLVGVRVEDPRVFQDIHRLPLRWVRDGTAAGLRVDHPDGLWNPTEYLQRLRAACPRAWILVEKILEPGESLPGDWPVDGTTGYDFLNLAGGVLVDPLGEAPLDRLYRDFTGESGDYTTLVLECKRQVLDRSFGSELNRLTRILERACRHRFPDRDFTGPRMREALRELAARFPVYRTYVDAERGVASPGDRERIASAVRAASGAADPGLLAFLGDLLALRLAGPLHPAETELAMRFQQLTGPAMAKGVEDTAFYRYHRLVALNEVGGDPGRFGATVDEFHRACGLRARTAPRTMLATSTHDTKRSEDVRARLALLSEIPDLWDEAVLRWAHRNEPRRARSGLPDRNAEYLLYQTLVGAWPIDAGRVVAFMIKAAREAKSRTSWTDPEPRYERALEAFVREALADAAFRADLERFVSALLVPGRINSLALTLLKLTAPGVPDLYQGTELWDLSLVDPDNRRPVDHALRARLLAELDGASVEQILARHEEGLPKLWLIRQALRLRRERLPSFAGGYTPLEAAGARAGHLLSFVRGADVLVAVPRLPFGLGAGSAPPDHPWRLEWGDARLTLPQGRWASALTGERWSGTVAARALLGRFPVGLLAREEAST